MRSTSARRCLPSGSRSDERDPTLDRLAEQTLSMLPETFRTRPTIVAAAAGGRPFGALPNGSWNRQL